MTNTDARAAVATLLYAYCESTCNCTRLRNKHAGDCPARPTAKIVRDAAKVLHYLDQAAGGQ